MKLSKSTAQKDGIEKKSMRREKGVRKRTRKEEQKVKLEKMQPFWINYLLEIIKPVTRVQQVR